jgi:hypothetical protein
MPDDKWSSCGPWIVQDPDYKREWLVPQPLQYYVHRKADGQWIVVDRWTDLAVGDAHRSRNGAIRAFYKWEGRKMPTGEALSKTPAPNHWC